MKKTQLIKKHIQLQMYHYTISVIQAPNAGSRYSAKVAKLIAVTISSATWLLSAEQQRQCLLRPSDTANGVYYITRW